MKSPLLLSLTVTTLAGILVSANIPAAPTFEAMDTDKDGHVSLKESEQLKSLPKVFKYMDKDENGTLEPVEYNYLRIGGEDNRRITPESIQTR